MGICGAWGREGCTRVNMPAQYDSAQMAALEQGVEAQVRVSAVARAAGKARRRGWLIGWSRALC